MMCRGSGKTVSSDLPLRTDSSKQWCLIIDLKLLLLMAAQWYANYKTIEILATAEPLYFH